MEKKYKQEFGDHTIPKWVAMLVEDGFLIDTSWHNDSTPSFSIFEDDETVGLRLTIDDADKTIREFPDQGRFVISIKDIDGVAYEGDDQQEVADILLKTDYDEVSRMYIVRLIGEDTPYRTLFPNESTALQWIEKFIKDNSAEV